MGAFTAQFSLWSTYEEKGFLVCMWSSLDDEEFRRNDLGLERVASSSVFLMTHLPLALLQQ
ncbi:hypothetical protein EJ110_NYTH03641 [Nymphaea thermarum]|nr:hypothetical protein EJ110_NYTH03641 [Nymphaea thermarum]